MKNTNYKVFIFFILLSIMFVLNILNAFNDYIDLKTRLSNDLISNTAISFNINNILTLDEIKTVFKENNNISLLNYTNENEKEKVIGIITSDKNFIPNLLYGRFFEKNDFFNNSLYAVIGANILDSKNIMVKNQEKYYNFNNNLYKIIGVINYNNYNSLNNIVYINMDYKYSTQNKTYYLDSYNKKNLKKARLYLKNYFKIDNFINDMSGLDKIINVTYFKKILSLIIYAFIIALLVGLIVILNYIYKNEFFIKIILGINYNRIFLDLYKELMKICFLSLITYIISAKLLLHLLDLQLQLKTIYVLIVTNLIVLIIALFTSYILYYENLSIK